MKKKILLTLLLIVTVIASSFTFMACDLLGGDVAGNSITKFKYTLSTDGTFYVLTGVENISESNVVVPESYAGKPVASIGARAFGNQKDMVSVTIPRTIERIGEQAFYGCSALTEINYNAISCGNSLTGSKAFLDAGSEEGITVNVGQAVLSIPDYLFEDAKNIKKVDFTESYKLQKIGEGAFSGCAGLQDVILPSSITAIGYGAFNGCFNLSFNEYEGGKYLGNENNKYVALVGASGKISAVNQNVKVIASWAISVGETQFDFTGITLDGNAYYLGDGINKYAVLLSVEDVASVYVNQNTKFINNNAFANLTSLRSVELPYSLTSIGDNAFSNCTALESITIPERITNIGKNAFGGCSKLKEINFNATICSNLSKGTFAYVGHDTDGVTINFGENVTVIPANLLYADVVAPKITAVNFAINTVCHTIGDNAFNNCKELSNIEIPYNVTSIGDWAFVNCTGLKTVSFDEKLSAIDKYAFYGCDLSNYALSLPSSVENLGAYAFAKTKIEMVQINKIIEEIAQGTFYGCRELVEVYFANDSALTYIGDYAFASSEKLNEISIPDSVTKIDANAFRYCTALQEIEIPASVECIGEYAFSDCASLSSVYFQATENWSAYINEFSYNELNNATISATYLTTTYCNYYWYKD